MIPRQLGMQGNAAMYSNANFWMQTFDYCCKQLGSSASVSYGSADIFLHSDYYKL